MLYSLKKLAKRIKKSSATIRIALDRYNIKRTILDRKYFYEISEEQMKELVYFIYTRRDLQEDIEWNKKWNKILMRK